MSKNPYDQITLEKVKVEQDRCFKRFIKGQIWGKQGTKMALMIRLITIITKILARKWMRGALSIW